MSESTISLKPVNDLLNEEFYVPSYQRGFRWTEQQVEDLLDDIWEFQSTCESKKHFYCLQPLVVKKHPNGKWELVDGQQRLTTILLILFYRRNLVEELGKSIFTLEFQTRPKSGEFLDAIDLDQQDVNIDYFHICRAYKAIQSWFERKGGSQYLQLISCLTNDEESGKNVKVIWYELPESEDPVNAFTRLNVGKIPLTDAELIRALFLRSRNFKDETKDVYQLKIAQEWDTIEQHLQSKEMWYFLTSGASSPASRIELLFQLIAQEHVNSNPKGTLTTFHFYNDQLSNNSNVHEEWLKVKRAFMTLDEWFHDRILFHLVGYLIYDGVKLSELRLAAIGATKSDFRQELRRRVFKRIFNREPPSDKSVETYKIPISEFVEGLDYDGDKKTIRSLLLLFNIATILLNSDSTLRFPFHHFKELKWDIEHVRSVRSDMPEHDSKCLEWINSFVSHMGDVSENKELCDRARAMRQQDEFDFDLFKGLYDDVLKEFQEFEDSDVDNGVGNLTLLDAQTNRSYKNAVFPVKRSTIIGLDREGTFVPICTKNLFLKCYSKEIGRMMFWGKEDRDSYRNAIIDTISHFFVRDIAK